MENPELEELKRKIQEFSDTLLDNYHEENWTEIKEDLINELLKNNTIKLGSLFKDMGMNEISFPSLRNN